MLPAERHEYQNNKFYQLYSGNVFEIDNFNGNRCEQLLKSFHPDIIVYGAYRILRKNIIDIPNIGILSAHPGLLPKYRGVDVIPWAIYHGDPLGVSIHFIDEKIDTGDVVAQRLIKVTKGDTFDTLMDQADKLAGELMCEVLVKYISAETIEVIPQFQLKNEGKQFYRMPSKLRRKAEKKLIEISGSCTAIPAPPHYPMLKHEKPLAKNVGPEYSFDHKISQDM